MIRNAKGEVFPSALRQFESRLYRWHKRYAKDCRESERANRAAVRAVLRARETRRRWLIATDALKRARR
jgi:hypothetical protein